MVSNLILTMDVNHPMKTTQDTCYAIRIGDRRYHQPYLMLDYDRTGMMIPALFDSREKAEAARPNQPSTKVVRVRIREG